MRWPSGQFSETIYIYKSVKSVSIYIYKSVTTRPSFATKDHAGQNLSNRTHHSENVLRNETNDISKVESTEETFVGKNNVAFDKLKGDERWKVEVLVICNEVAQFQQEIALTC